MDLHEDRNKYAKYLTTVTKRKLAFALAIISEPSIILLDGKNLMLNIHLKVLYLSLSLKLRRTNKWYGS
jgi:ABC-type branched-subunit amino acid transport system ATPase component